MSRSGYSIDTNGYRRAGRLGAPLTLLAVLAGCTGGGGRPDASPSPVPPSVSPAATSTAPTPVPTARAAGARCASGQLAVSVTPGPNAAGHVGLKVQFTNTAAVACTMTGYPGVSFVTGESGTQIGDPAERVGGPATAVTVASHGQAHANLLLGQVDNYAATACQPVQAAGLRVYPPDETTALYAAAAVRVCSATGTGFAQIYPLEAGP